MAEIITLSTQIGTASENDRELIQYFHFENDPAHIFRLTIYSSGEKQEFSFAKLSYLSGDGFSWVYSIVTSSMKTVTNEANADNLDEADFAEDIATLHAFAETEYNLRTA